MKDYRKHKATKKGIKISRIKNSADTVEVAKNGFDQVSGKPTVLETMTTSQSHLDDLLQAEQDHVSHLKMMLDAAKDRILDLKELKKDVHAVLAK